MNCNSTISNLNSKILKFSFGISFATLAIVSSITNAIVLVTLHKFKVLHTVTNQMLAHLATTDFLLAVLVPPLFLLQLFFESMETNCKVESLRRFLASFLIGMSGGIIAIISYDRYLHLKRLNSYKMTKKQLRYLTILCLVLSFTISSLRFAKESQRIYSAAVLLFLSLVFFSIFLCYILIGSALYQHNKIKNLRGLNNRNKSYHRRACKTAILIVTSFSVTVIPLAWFQIQTLLEYKPGNLALGYTLGILIALLNTVINPVIYYYRTPKLRHCLKQTVQLKFRYREPEQKISNASFQYTHTTQL